jgi:hypothetical protein
MPTWHDSRKLASGKLGALQGTSARIEAVPGFGYRLAPPDVMTTSGTAIERRQATAVSQGFQ